MRKNKNEDYWFTWGFKQISFWQKEESNKLKRVKKAQDRKSIHEGICEECGAQDFLYRINGMLICESCRNSM